MGHMPGGGGGIKKKLWSQLVRENLNGALTCGIQQWKLCPFHTVSTDFQVPKTHANWNIEKITPIPHTGGFYPLFVYTLSHNFQFLNPPFHTEFRTSWLLHFFFKPPPRGHMAETVHFQRNPDINTQRLRQVNRQGIAFSLDEWDRALVSTHTIWGGPPQEVNPHQ